MFSIPCLAWEGMKGFSIQGGPALPKCQVTNSPRRMATGKWGWRLNYSVLSSQANWASSQPQEIFRGRNSLYIFPLILSLAFEILFYILLSILKGILWRKDQFLGLTRLRVLKVLGGGTQFSSSLRIKHLCFLSLWENSRHGGSSYSFSCLHLSSEHLSTGRFLLLWSATTNLSTRFTGGNFLVYPCTWMKTQWFKLPHFPDWGFNSYRGYWSNCFWKGNVLGECLAKQALLALCTPS